MSLCTYIILLNYNSFNDTCECILSLMNLKSADFKIIVVDNSETSEDFKKLIDFANQMQFSTISFNENDINYIYKNESLVFIKSNKNNGFAHGNNLGLKFALAQNNAEYFWILNNDTIVDLESLKALKKCILKNSKVILGSKLLYYHKPNIIQAVGGVFNECLYICEHVAEGKDKHIDKVHMSAIDYPIGASMFVSRAFLNDVGLLSEDFFLYYEELDWVFRAKKLGYIADWCEDSIVYHKEGGTIGSSYKNEKSFFSETELFKSRKKFVKKYYSLSFKFYFSSMLLIVNRFRKGKFKLVKELIKITFNDA